MSIDWSKAPEGATHWDPVDRNHLRQLGEIAQSWNEPEQSWTCKGWQYPDDLSTMPRLIKRPVWSGEGLPPVGMICELRAHKLTEFSPAVIRFASRNVVVWDWQDEPAMNGLCTAYAHDVEIRPIRTADQIAAEERAKQVEYMVGFIRERRMSVSTPENPKQEAVIAAEALYDAGFRRSVQ